MKKTIVIAALSFTTLTIAAQDEPKGKTLEERVKMRTEKMAQQLQLSNDQKDKVFNANLKTAQSVEEIRNQIKSLHEKQKALLEEHDKEMKSILTEEQYQKYLQIREENKEKRKEKRQAIKEQKK